jgi:hypothetical protein
MIITGPRAGVRVATKKKEQQVQRQGFEPLLKRDIDQRIEHVMAVVAPPSSNRTRHRRRGDAWLPSGSPRASWWSG